MKRLSTTRRLSAGALLALSLFAQDRMQRVYEPMVVVTPEGNFHLTDLRLWEYSSLRPGFIGPRPSGLIENLTGTAWTKLQLQVKIQCAGGGRKSTSIFIYNISATESQRFKSRSSDADNVCDVESVEIVFGSGVNDRAEEREAEKKRRQEAAEIARKASLREAEVERETKKLASKIAALRVPASHNEWPGAADCQDALALYDLRHKEHRWVIESMIAQPTLFVAGQRVAVISRRGGCAEVRFIKENLNVYVASALVPLSQDERVAADNTARANAAAAKRRSDYEAALAKLPHLQNGDAGALFIGADRKCSEQFVQALSMEGLEKRKRLADLVSFGCGFIEDAGNHITKIGSEGSSCLVRLENGSNARKSGWVPCSWIKQ